MPDRSKVNGTLRQPEVPSSSREPAPTRAEDQSQTAQSITLALNRPTSPSEVFSPPHAEPPKPQPPPSQPSVGTVAIVIDDFGLDMKMAKKFLDIPLPITFSILPYQPYSEKIAKLAHSHGREVLLHLPMEPHGYPMVNPGQGALLLSMSLSRLQDAVQAALDASPYVAGVNNHMGSRFTEDKDSMRIVLAVLRQRGLYFLDSATSDQSVGYTLAKELRIPSIRRDIFLDHTPTEDFVRSQITQLIRRAKIAGTALAIGHPRESTWKVLRQEAGRFEREGIAVVTSRELMVKSQGGKP